MISISEPEELLADRPEFLVARQTAFRAAKGPLSISEEGIEMSPSLARALEIEVGEEVRYAPPRRLEEKNGRAPTAAREREQAGGAP